MVDAARGIVHQVVAAMSHRLYPVQIAPADCGATLIGTARRDVPLVTVSIECKGGEACAPPNTPGLAELTAALFNEGVHGMPPLEWHRQLENDAIAMELHPETLRWVAHLNCLSSDLDRALDLFAQWLTQPGLPRGEWKRLVKSFRAGAREQWAQPIGIIDTFSCVQALGRTHPLGRPAFEKSYARARYGDACRMGQQAFCQGSDLQAMIGGDIDIDQGFERLGSLLANLPQERQPLADAIQSEPAANPVWILDNPDIDQVYFALARPGCRAGDPDRIALRLANYAIGSGGFSSRLMQRVRSEMGHTYGIHSSLPMDELMSPFQIQSFTHTTNLGAMLDLITDELDLIRSTGFTAAEVADARQHLHGSLPLHLTSPDAILHVVSAGLWAGLEVEDLEADWQAIPTTSLEQVNEAARRLIGDGAFHLALIGPAQKILPQVDKRGPAAVFPFRTPPDRWLENV